MDRINGANTVDIGSGRRGFRDVNTVTGVAGTEVTALWLNMLQEEVSAVILDAGIALDPGDWGQLLKALRSRSAGRPSWVPVISMTVTAPPSAPATGDRYLIPPGATGVWTGRAYSIAEWLGLTWSITAQPNGHGIGLPDGRVFVNVGGTYIEKFALDAQSGKWNSAVAGGTANTLTATLSPAMANYGPSFPLNLFITTTNTGPAGLNLNGFGVRNIVTPNGQPTQAGDLPAGRWVSLVYDGTNFQMTSPPSATGFTNLIQLGTSGTFTVPDGCYLIRPWLTGSGGGGGSSQNNDPAAGGGGAPTGMRTIRVVPGQTFPFTLGNGGNGGNTQQAGLQGGTSTGFGMTITGGGGGSGQVTAISSRGGGAPGTCTGADIVFPGQYGGLLSSQTSSGTGGPGGAPGGPFAGTPGIGGASTGGVGNGFGGGGGGAGPSIALGGNGRQAGLVVEY